MIALAVFRLSALARSLAGPGLLLYHPSLSHGGQGDEGAAQLKLASEVRLNGLDFPQTPSRRPGSRSHPELGGSMCWHCLARWRQPRRGAGRGIARLLGHGAVVVPPG